MSKTSDLNKQGYLRLVKRWHFRYLGQIEVARQVAKIKFGKHLATHDECYWYCYPADHVISRSRRKSK